MSIARRAVLLGAALAAARPAWAEAETAALLPPGAVSRTARLNGIAQHFVVAGSGPPLVLLHGWPQTWFTWRDTIAALSGRFRVIAPDLRASASPSARRAATTSAASRPTSAP